MDSLRRVFQNLCYAHCKDRVLSKGYVQMQLELVAHLTESAQTPFIFQLILSF